MSTAGSIAELDSLRDEAVRAFRDAKNADELEAARIRYLGQKQGRLREVQQFLGKLPKQDRPAFGKRFNQLSRELHEAHESAIRRLAAPQAAAAPRLDVTLPGLRRDLGRRHPLVQTAEELIDILGRLGFSLATGPEVEDEWHNFDALNIPPAHPARDPNDNFYITDSMLLRSQTSTIQIRVMETQPPPVRVIAIGRVYRPDTTDATHSPMFHQIEGLCVDEGITMAHLKTVLRLFTQAYLGQDVQIRFRPSFFPFTEPSIEVDMSWDIRGGKWVELAGAGMVDPNVFQALNQSRIARGLEPWYDPEKYTGFAFGLGIERLCMRRHGIDDIRLFYQNDVRFLRQF